MTSSLQHMRSMRSKQSMPSMRSVRLTPISFDAPESRCLQSSQWILSPRLDLIFICGGLLWLLFIGFFSLSKEFNPQSSITVLLTLAGAFFFADAHNAATILRLIEEPGLAKAHPIVGFALPFVFIATAALLLLHSSWLSPAITLYMIVVAQHATAQAYGITMIYLRKSGLSLSFWQVKLVRAAFHSMMTAAILRQFCAGAPAESLGVSTLFPHVFNSMTPVAFDVLAVLVTASMLGMLMWQCRKSEINLHPGACLLTLSTLAVFTVGQSLHIIAAVLAPAFLHGGQYLAVTTSLFLKQQKENQIGRVLDLYAHFGKLLSLGLALYFILPFGISRLGFSTVDSMAVVFLTINFHHFIADAVIWKMRPHTQQKLLLS